MPKNNSMIFKTDKNGITIGGKTIDEISDDFDKLSNYISNKTSKISSDLSSMQDKLSSKDTQPMWSYDELPDNNVSKLTEGNFSIADKIREQKEYNELLENENSSIDTAIELSKRRTRNYDESLPKLIELNDEYEKQHQLESDDNYNTTIKERNNEYEKYLSNLNSEIEESKKAQAAIENTSPDVLEDLGYKQKGYLKEIREEQKQFSDALTKIDTSSIESLLPKKEDVKGYYDELLSEQKEFQSQLNTIEATPIDSLKRDQFSEILSEQADGQMALNLSSAEYNDTLSTQNDLSNQRVLTLSEEANGQMALVVAENESISAKQKDITQTTSQIAAKEALIEASNKELLSNVNEKLAKAGVTSATDELTIAKLREVAASNEEGSALAKETLEMLGLGEASKAASIALKGLAMVGNMIAAWAIAEVLQLAVKGLDELANSVDNCKERVDNLMSSYQSTLDTANSNASRVEELASDYEKLSKGVNNLGENVSLTSEEYEQYNSLVTEIADMFPTLIQGYNDQGIAILNLKGNVEGLRDAYKEAQTEAYNMLISSGEDNDGNDIIKQWEDVHDPGFFAGLFDFGAADVGGKISVSDALAQLKEIQNLTAEEYRNIENITSAGSHKEIESLTDIQKEIGYGSYIGKALGIDENVTDKEFKEAKNQAKVLVQTYNAEIESALSDVETLANAYLMTNDDYSKLTDNSKTAASLLVNNLTEDIADDFSSKEDVGVWVDSIVTELQNNPTLSNAINGLFTTDLSNMSVDDAKAVVDQYINTIAKILNEDPVELKVRLGFDDYNDDDIAQLKTKVQEFLKDEDDDKVGELSLDDLQIASKLEIPEGTLLSWDELKQKIEETKTIVSDSSTSLPSLDDLRTQINGASDDTTNLADELKLVQEVIQSTGQISEETYTKLLSCSSKYSSAVKTENGRLTINKSKLKATALMRSSETKKTIQQVKAQKQLEYLKKAKELNIYNNTLLDTTSETYDNVTALQDQITQLSMLTEQLNTATDAFQNFKDAQSSDDLDMYNTSSDAFKTIKDALESGQVGSDDMRAAMELLMSQDQYKEFLKAGHSEENALEKQYLFMEKWADTNKKFFGDDMKQNAINFFEYLDKTGLLADGVLATSEEIGKQTGLSVDAVNSLIQFGNMYGFQDIIQQSQIDYVNDYVEKMQNLQSAKEAFQQANESDPNSNITLGLKDDLSNAQKELDDFYADIPKKFNDISEEYMNTTTDKSLGEYFTEQMGGDDNTLAYMQSIGDRLKYIDQEKNRLSVQNKDKGIFSTSQYKALEDEESVLKGIQEQLETSNDTYQKAIANTGEYVKLVAKKKNIQKAMSQSGSDSEIKQLSGELSEVQGQLDALSAPTQIQLSLDKSEVESEIQNVTSQIERLTSMSNNISLKINQGDTSAGAYQALNAINNAKNTAQNQKADLQGKLADIETTIKYVADTTEIDAAKDSIPDNTDSNVTFKVNGLSELERAKSIIDSLQSKTITVNVNANTAGVSTANFGKNGMPSNIPVHYDGTAHAGGNWGLAQNENNSLVGELGTEGLVRDGKFYLIGANGAQFMNLKKNDIIFNHKQVAELQRNGHINSRGKTVKNAYVNGTLVGTAHSDNVNNKWNTPYIKNGADTIKQNKALKKAKDEMDKAIEDTTDDAKDKSEEVFDWIERKVKKLQRLFERWTNNAEKTFSKDLVGTYYKKATSNLTQQLDTQEKAYARYLAEAEKSPISDEYKNKIKNGVIDIETIIEEAADNGEKTLADNINNYQTYYDKATDALTAFEEAAEKKFNIPIEKAAQKVELFKNSIDLLDKKIDNAIGATAKNKLIDKQLKDQKATEKAYKEAQKSTAKAVKTQSKNMVSSSVLKSSDVSKSEKKSIKKSVKNGKELDLSMFTEGSKAYTQAVKYNEAIRANTQATLDYNNAVQEYISTAREAEKTKFDNIATDFENKISLLEHKVTTIDNQISDVEARGLTAGKSFYTAQKQINADQLAYYKQEKSSLEAQLPNIKKGTEAWYDAQSKIQDCANSIATCEQNVYKLNESIRNVDIKKFEKIGDQISAISTEADFLNGLIGNDPLFDDDKVMTDAGLATLGNYSAQYYASKANANNDSAEISRLKKMLSDGSWKDNNFDSAQQVEDRISELYGTWQGHINDLNSAQKNIYDMMNQELDNQLDKIKELIEKKKEELEAEKDLHDYQRSISEKTKDISTLQKQIAAYSGNTSQEAQAKVQKLQSQLDEKQKDLQDTEYDKYISDQEDILDKLLKELEEANKKQLNDFMKLVNDGLNLANANSDKINSTIQQYAKMYGYDPQYVKDFKENISGGVTGDGETTIKSYVKSIAEYIAKKANESVEEKKNETQGSDGNGGGNANVVVGGKTMPTGGISAPEINTTKAQNVFQEALSKDDQKKTQKKEATNFIKAKAGKPSKKKKEYSDLNQKIWDFTGGKILSSANLKALAKSLGVTYDNAKKTGKLYKKLHSLGLKGFAKGGIVRDELEGQIKANGDSLLASVNPNETVLTEKFTELMPNAVDMMSKFVKVDLPDFSMIKPISQPTTIDSHIDINLPNVENGIDFIEELKKPKNQKALRSVTTDLLAGGAKLSINKFK